MRTLLPQIAVAACLAAGPGYGGETSAKAPNSAPQLSPLPTAFGGTNADARLDWNRARKDLKRQWIEFLGPFPRRKAPLEAQELKTEELGDFTRRHIKYQVEAGVDVDGYLLVPKAGGDKHPAVVVFHPTTRFGPRGVAGLEPAYPREKWQGVDLVGRGWVVWCPRNYINTEGADWAANARAVMARHPRWTGMTRMVWDAIRAADFLESRPEVDPKRIACLGHSLGAKVVLYVMAFDERYCAGVMSEGGVGLEFSNWDAPWYLGPQIRRPGFHLEHHQLLALAAPRPMLLIAGDSADGERSRAFLDAARPVYELFGAGAGLRFFNHHQGHVYGSEARDRAERFLAENLAPKLERATPRRN
jgi:dienelactone hydrolase